jgi:exopolysaccharide biosynthesis protein
MWRALAILLFAAESASAAPTMIFSGDPYPGIHRETWMWNDAGINARIRIVQVNLTSSEIAVYATQESDRGITTSEYADRKNAQVAINGDAFAVAGYVPRGLAMGGGNPWSQTADDPTSAVFHLRRVGERTYAGIVPPESVVTPDDLPGGTEGVISGRPILVRQSVANTQYDCSDPVTIPCQAAPRTAVAVSADGNTLWLVVVDGWQSVSLGLKAQELADFLVARGAGNAIALDGGSSSTLVLDGSVISSPSDGVERAVANHLAVKYGMLPKGEMYGLICKHSVVGCADDPARKISGASVKLDDGRSVTTDTTAAYDFLNVTPRLACVTVKKTGYLTTTQCHQVVAGQLNYNSVAMWEGTDPPPDPTMTDAGISADASPLGDAQTGDGGNGFDDPGGGCCQIGSEPNPLLVLVAFFVLRRRGTNA